MRAGTIPEFAPRQGGSISSMMRLNLAHRVVPLAMRQLTPAARHYLAESGSAGFSRNGIDPKAVLAKFDSITAGRLGEAARNRIIDAAMTLDRAATCANLVAAVATPG